ncbi:Heterokaryon incompatibility protein [Paramyrothecium foliicola]|nr:Heterokaryon incompatibility protein [Paramyrothecium foliicola]
MEVQQNALDVLIDLRLHDQLRIIWIDAICINQANGHERSAQVEIMNLIYSQAGEVVIWLGRADKHSDTAMNFAASLDKQKYVDEFSHYCDAGFPIKFEIYKRKTYFFDHYLETANGRELAVSIVSFINRPWFGRIWVQQEGSLNRKTNVICGTATVEWHRIFALAWILTPPKTGSWPEHLPYTFTESRNNLMAIQNIQLYKTKAFSSDYTLSESYNRYQRFSQLLMSTQRFVATNPLDKIFALIGLHLPRNRREYDYIPKPVYSIPWEVLYTDVTRQVEESLMSDELRRSKHRVKNKLQNCITLRGLMLDEISYVGDFVQQDLNFINANCSETYMNGDPSAEAYKLTIISATDGDEELVDKRFTLDNWESWFRWLSPENQDPERPLLSTAIEGSGVFHTFRFAITKHGYFCLVPSITKVNDSVAVLAGYTACTALRPWTSDGYFELLGDSYVHGMMHNEAGCIDVELDCKANPTDAQRERILRDSQKNGGEAWRTLGIGDYTSALDTLGKRQISIV